MPAKPRESQFKSYDAVIVGNTCLYGATGGKFFAAGGAGERFAVRNSGAIAVVESVGDHCCEYMTGGTIIVLGSTGINFGAGMTGGMAFVLDLNSDFEKQINPEMVTLHALDQGAMAGYSGYLLGLITEFVEQTGSKWGAEILAQFPSYLSQFTLVTTENTELDHLLQLSGKQE